MSPNEAQNVLNAYIKKNGPWTAHSICLADGVNTMGSEANPNQILYLRRILQLCADLSSKPLDGIRVLDLGSLEGGFAIEFAMHGAEVVAIEGRSKNCERIRFVKNLLRLSNLQILEADVRKLDSSDLGSFDIVLCLGLLYHVDKSSILEFCRLLYDLTRHLCVIDTHFAFYGNEMLGEYQGDLFWENSPDASDLQVNENNWSCLDRLPSYFFTETSLRNLISDLGFSSLYVCENPYYRIMLDRRTFIAIKGQPIELKSCHTPPLMPHPVKPYQAVVEPINSALDDSCASKRQPLLRAAKSALSRLVSSRRRLRIE